MRVEFFILMRLSTMVHMMDMRLATLAMAAAMAAAMLVMV